MTATIILSVVVIILVLIVFMQQRHILRQRILLKGTGNKNSPEQLPHEDEIQQSLSKKTEAQIRELLFFSSLLSDKNHLLQQIRELIKQPADNYEKIEELIRNDLNTNDEWNYFMFYFNKIYPCFFDNLKTHSSRLTKKDLKLSAYIRIDIPTKQIAQLLNIDPHSVKISRHRLKKKLNLNEGDDLEEFIKSV